MREKPPRFASGFTAEAVTLNGGIKLWIEDIF